MADNIEQKLKEIERKRMKLHDQLAHTSSVLGEVEDKIDELNARQQARMRSDDKIDNRIADRIAQGKAGGESVTGESLPAPIARTDEKSISVRLVPDGLTNEELTVRPGERIADRPFLFSEAIENSLAGASLKNSDGVFLYANQTIHDFFGAAPGMVVGKTDYYWQPKELADQSRRNDLQVLDTGSPLEAVEMATLPDGKAVYWYVYKFPAPCATETLLAVVSLQITDLVARLGPEAAKETARKRREKMELLKDQLLRLARRMTDKLNASRKVAEDLLAESAAEFAEISPARVPPDDDVPTNTDASEVP